MSEDGAIQDLTIDYRTYPILIVDDEEAIVKTFRLTYGREFTVIGTSSPLEALQLVESEPIALMVTDQRMPEMAGTELIRRALDIKPGLIPIILTGYTDVESLVKAVNLRRVYRYVPKPWDRDELRDTMAHAIEMFHVVRQNATLLAENSRLVAELERANEQLRRENRYLRAQAMGGGFEAIIGRSPSLTRVIELARRVASSSATVLIQGPTGTGKELLARAIHEASPRHNRLFVAVNAATMTETLLASTLFGHRRGSFTGASADQKGLFEVASGGTLFLDEIGETTPALQVHLLRVLQEGEIHPVGAQRPVKIDVRVIAATNRDLDAEVEAGRFREDLLHRLKVFPLRLPSLNERRDDIPLLAEDMLARLAQKLGKAVAGIDADAMAALCAHDYRGNVRELGNLLERALLLCEPGLEITIDDLFENLPAAPPATPAAGDLLSPEGGGAVSTGVAPGLTFAAGGPTSVASGIEGAGGTNAAPSLAATVLRFESERIRETLEQCKGNKSEAARRLGLTRVGFLKKLARCERAVSGSS